MSSQSARRADLLLDLLPSCRKLRDGAGAAAAAARHRPDRAAGAEPGHQLDPRPGAGLALGVLLADLLRALADVLVGRDAGLDVDADDVARADRQQRRVVLLGVERHCATTSGLVDRWLMSVVPAVAHWTHQLPPDLARAGERGGVGGGLGARAQDRGLADLEHQDRRPRAGRASRPAGPAGSVRVPRGASRFRTVGPGGLSRMGRGTHTVARDRGSTFIWDPFGPASRRILAAMNPRQRRGSSCSPSLHSGSLACSCSWRGTWPMSAPRWTRR